MGVRKPDQVITHRIELQKTERDTLEAALAGRFVTNGITAVGSVFAGIGAALTPFQGALTALTALWIADRTFDEIKEGTAALAEGAMNLIFPQLDDSQAYYTFIIHWLTANPEWNQMLNKDYEVTEHLEKMDAWPFLIQKFRDFRKRSSQLRSEGGSRWHVDYTGQTPAQRWIQFYPVKIYNDAVKDATRGKVKRTFWPF